MGQHQQLKRSKFITIIYWILTGIIALQVAVGAILDLSGNPAFVDITRHLGYPPYLLTVLGVVRIGALIVILAPGFPILKEWTYAGLFYEYILAVTSHVIVGDGVGKWISAAVFAIILIGSWALRPPSRKLSAGIES